MKLRIITGLIAAVILVLVLFVGGARLHQAVILFLSAVAYLEVDAVLFGARSFRRQLRQVLLILLTVFVISVQPSLSVVLVWGHFAILGLAALWSPQTFDCKAKVDEIALECLAYLYVVSLFGFLLPILQLNSGGPRLLLFLLLIVFGGDTAAYFVGSRWGKTPLAPSISPKKTKEGSLAAIGVSVVLAWVWLKFWAPSSIPSETAYRFLLFAPAASLLAQSGDLFESLIKRSCGKKDSGSLFPGHGGLLDRIDGFAFSVPAYAWYLHFVVFGK